METETKAGEIIIPSNSPTPVPLSRSLIMCEVNWSRKPASNIAANEIGESVRISSVA